jgi:lipopolysaccharide heptosyltransferase II
MRILLIRLRLIGDVVFTTPAVAAVARRFPGATITYLVEPAAEPIVRLNPHVQHVVVAERPRGWRRPLCDVRLARALRHEAFDLVIDFHGGPRSAWLTWATRAPQRIGYAIPGRTWAYTDRVPWTRALVPPRHSVESQWALLGPIGVEAPDAERHPVEMPVSTDAAAAVTRRLRAAGVPERAQVIVLHVSAGNPFRRWPAGHFVTLVSTLARAADDRRIVISSGPSDEPAANAVASRARALAGDAADRIVRCGEFDLSELRALVDRAALYIGGDSGPLHIASTSAVPIIGLFGPTLPDRSMPWRPTSRPFAAIDAGPLPCRPCHQRRCVPGDFRCLTRIDPDGVAIAAERLLARLASGPQACVGASSDHEEPSAP